MSLAFLSSASLISALVLIGAELVAKPASKATAKLDAKKDTTPKTRSPRSNTLLLENVNAKEGERNDVITGVLVFLNVKNDNVYLILGNNAHNTVRYY